MEKDKIKIWAGVLIVLICGVFYLCVDHRTKGTTVVTGSFEDTAASDDTTAAKKDEKDEKIYIDICGEVKNPGVYVFDSEPRIVEVVERAGGFTKKADKNALNQAQTVSDGTKLTVEAKKNGVNSSANGKQGTEGKKESEKSLQSEGKININQATKEELMALNGIGESRAREIISYRETNGRFSKIEDLMNIPGIKDGIFNRVRDKITV